MRPVRFGRTGLVALLEIWSLSMQRNHTDITSADITTADAGVTLDPMRLVLHLR